ncbi:MAG: YicC family protein [Kiritimatiellae bacterium]|nr:YicC family protein [Kiritimatiellia bacterium]
MSINSMTGHGVGEVFFKGARVIMEISSLNHRQFDLRLDLPPCLASLEMEMRRQIHAVLARGSVACRGHVVSGGKISVQRIAFDHGLARQCFQEARRAARQYKAPDDFGVSSLFNIPGVARIIPADGSAVELKKPALRAVRRALRQLRRMRVFEGRALEREMRRRLRALETMLAGIARRRPAAARQYKGRIRTLLTSAAENAGNKKILRDILALAERGDIAEELERSRSHFAQFKELLAGKCPAGRTLDFLVQELMREINTIGAKSNDCAISNLVVKYKSELESIREQVQNIE